MTDASLIDAETDAQIVDAVMSMPDAGHVDSVVDRGPPSDLGPDVATAVDVGQPDAAQDTGPPLLPDLVLLRDRLVNDVWLDEKIITEESCVLLERCVGGIGRRLLLRFSVVTANIGDVDLLMGRPQENEDLFEYSECHEHFHFESYANYALFAPEGDVSLDGGLEGPSLDGGAREMPAALDGGAGPNDAEAAPANAAVEPVDAGNVADASVIGGEGDMAIPPDGGGAPLDGALLGDGSVVVDMGYLPPPEGDPVALGRKQAFCLMDTSRYLEDDPEVREEARYGCNYQGISRGWQDVYGSHLDCQWIDVTDIPPGDYRLQVQINREHIIPEKTFDNNDHTVVITIPPYDIAAACPDGARSGTRRSCGWTAREVVRCHEGDLVEIGCGGCGELGEPCAGNPMMRICEGRDAQCLPSTALTQSDNGCGDTQCPHVEFMCPESRVFTVWTADNDITEPSTCNYAIRSGPPQLTRPCNEVAPRGLERLCGWTRSLDNVECRPGFTYRAGCTGGMDECRVGPRCEGDPMLRVCEGEAACLSARALAQSDDGCGTQCPAVGFECPLRGRVSVFTASYRDDRLSVCEPELRIVE